MTVTDCWIRPIRSDTATLGLGHDGPIRPMDGVVAERKSSVWTKLAAALERLRQRTESFSSKTRPVLSKPRPTCWNWSRRSTWLPLNWILIWLLMLLSSSGCQAVGPPALLTSKPAVTSDIYRPLREKEICPSVDIRNTVDGLRELENCTVVEGFVNIVLIEQANSSMYLNHSYPKLREITGYLLLYRANGLQSLRNLFPNLAVIRGQSLFSDYALVVYEMMQLQELGLPSLTDIQRGAVLIEKNPVLCFIETIDWNLIAKSGRGVHFFRDNKDPSTCPICPSRCPVASDDGRRLCWNSDDCQKVCDLKICGNNTCYETNRSLSVDATSESGAHLVPSPPGGQHRAFCCHEECLGGCTGVDERSCHVCRNVIDNGECRATCKPGTYLFMNRRCVTDIECAHMPPPREYQNPNLQWKPFEDKCILECPTGFKEANTTSGGVQYRTCVRCDGPCPKACQSKYVTNLETAQSLKGCTKIMGSLDIQVKGNSIVRELEENLQHIEEIDGYLKVARSYPLVTLNFLRNLKVIRGNGLDNEVFALVLTDNQNLAELWDWTRRSRNLTISNGKMLVHFNPKLCPSQIDELRSVVLNNSSPGHQLEVSQSSNGEKASCSQDLLTLNITRVTALNAIAKWDDYRFKMADTRALLGYVVSYIEAPYQNVTFYDGRDACGGDGWRIIDFGPESTDEFISPLKPFTQYAVYVQTFTIGADRSGRGPNGPQVNGARSNIVYFRTRPAEPEQPQDLRATAITNSELRVEWNPPKNPNGIVTHYIVYGTLNRDEQEYYDKRNYCHDQLAPGPTDSRKSGTASSSENSSTANRSTGNNWTSNTNRGPHGNSMEIDPVSPTLSGSIGGAGKSSQCDCSSQCSVSQSPSLEQMEKEQQFRINFENHLHNRIYVKQQKTEQLGQRSKREVETTAASGSSTPGSGSVASTANNVTTNSSGKEFPVESDGQASGKTSLVDVNETLPNKYVANKLIQFQQTFYNQTSVSIKELWHFAAYTIEVRACQDPDPGETTKRCSEYKALTSARTKPLENADDIPGIIRTEEVLNQTSVSVRLRWDEPYEPNGLILKYLVEYKKVEGDSHFGSRYECVSRKDFVDANRTKILHDLAPGNYVVRVRAYSLNGPGRFSNNATFRVEIPHGTITGGTIAGIFVLVLFICGIAAFTIGYYVIKKKRSLITSTNPDYHKYVPDNWEADRENVQVIRELGQGSFGKVYEGIIRNVVEGQPEVRCAIKTVNEKASVAERIQFLHEASVMKEFDAHHVVKLLGVVSKGQPTLVIMELMAHGDLKMYLRSRRPDAEENGEGARLPPPTLKCILKMAIEVADGMAYLAEKKFVHRDLAARNCMVSEDLTVKIGDFGMTRDIYEMDYYRKGGKGLLPVRWMAPESLRDGVFTTQCDVWSFGVVLWEMATLASQPYQGLSNEQVLKYVMDGAIMERPEGCPDRLYKLMEMCWSYLPRHRPSFLDIIEDLLPDVPASQFAAVSFYHSDAGVDARATQRSLRDQETRHYHDPSTPLRASGADGSGSDQEKINQVNPAHQVDRVLQIDEDEDNINDLGIDEDDQCCEPMVVGEVGRNVHRPEDELLEDDDDDDDGIGAIRDDLEDHVPVLFPYDQRAYILVRNPGHGAGASNGGTAGGSNNGSKASESSSKGTTIPSEDSKGSYVSNGSASNGYVKGLLRHRAEC